MRPPRWAEDVLANAHTHAHTHTHTYARTTEKEEEEGVRVRDCRVDSERMMMTAPRHTIPGKTVGCEAEKHGTFKLLNK